MMLHAVSAIQWKLLADLEKDLEITAGISAGLDCEEAPVRTELAPHPALRSPRRYNESLLSAAAGLAQGGS